MAFENMTATTSRRISGVEILRDFFGGVTPEDPEVVNPECIFTDGAIASRTSVSTSGHSSTSVAVRDAGGSWYVTHNASDVLPYKISDAMILHPSSNWEVIYNG